MTTIGTLLAEGDSRTRTFDPEWVGYVLANNLPDSRVADFQRLASWRTLPPSSLTRSQGSRARTSWRFRPSSTHRPQRTVLDELEADESITRQRIDADPVGRV